MNRKAVDFFVEVAKGSTMLAFSHADFQTISREIPEVAIPLIKTEPFSEAQLASQAKMRVVNVFFKTFGEFLRMGFMTNDKISRDNAYNRAVSYNRINAVAGIYPHFVVDYSRAG